MINVDPVPIKRRFLGFQLSISAREAGYRQQNSLNSKSDIV